MSPKSNPFKHEDLNIGYSYDSCGYFRNAKGASLSMAQTSGIKSPAQAGDADPTRNKWVIGYKPGEQDNYTLKIFECVEQLEEGFTFMTGATDLLKKAERNAMKAKRALKKEEKPPVAVPDDVPADVPTTSHTIRELEAENARLNAENARLETEAENARLNAENAELRANILGFKAENARLETINSELRAENANANANA